VIVPWVWRKVTYIAGYIVMTGHLILFLVCFSVIFCMFYIQNWGVLTQLLIISRYCNVFYIWVCNSILSKHSNFRVFWCNSRRNHANRQNKTFKDFWRPWEDEEWRFKRPRKALQNEEDYSQVPRHLIWKQTPKKTKKNRRHMAQTTPHAPDTCYCAPKHMLRPLAHASRCLTLETPFTCAWRMVLTSWGLFLRVKALFCDFLVQKAWYFSKRYNRKNVVCSFSSR